MIGYNVLKALSTKSTTGHLALTLKAALSQLKTRGLGSKESKVHYDYYNIQLKLFENVKKN